MFKTREEIDQWLIRHKVLNYTINEDLTVDVNDDVHLDRKYLYEIPVQFGTVNGGFEISYGYLKSLKGCPHTVNGDFYCQENELRSLKDGPKKVQGEYWASNNKIKTLNGLAEGVERNLFINDNPLNSFKTDVKTTDFSINADMLEGFESYKSTNGVIVPIEDVHEYYKKLKLFKKLGDKLPEGTTSKKPKI